MVHIELTTIKRQLQAQMHYPLTPEEADGRPTLDQAFDVLLSGFGAWLIRNKWGTHQSIHEAKTRGWMTEKMADLFTDYCIKGWRVV